MRARGTISTLAALGTALLFAALLVGCSDVVGGGGNASGNDSSESGAAPPPSTGGEDRADLEDAPAGEEPEQSGSVEPYFYFSYDDSASTAAVELVKYALERGDVPGVELARPWEFYNYEDFEPAETEAFAVFDVSFGLWERTSGTAEDTAMEYKLGVSVASQTLERSDNAVLTLVVDVSGSMGNAAVRTEEVSYTRMEIVRRALTTMVEEALIEGDVVNLVTFSSDASRELTDAQYPVDGQTMLDAIDRLRPTDATNLAEGIDLGYEAAVASYDSQKVNRVILLTDAFLNTGETDVSIISENTRINNQEGIYFAGVGISGDVNDAALNELTDAGKGAYFTVRTRTDAERVFSEKFVSLLQVAARDVRFRLDYPQSMSHASTASEEASQDEQEVTPTNFSYNTNQYFFEGFTAEAAVDTSAELTLTVHYRDPTSYEEQTASITKTVGEILNRDMTLIRDAEAIFLLTELVAGNRSYEEVQAILERHYEGYTSPLFDEYTGLIEDYNDNRADVTDTEALGAAR